MSTPPMPGAGAFATTRWTLVLSARGTSPEAQIALSELCAAYWQPVFGFIQRIGLNEDTARELTQEFFARLLTRHGLDSVEPGRGRFRSFLLGAVKHFLSDRRDHETALKRGGNWIAVPLDAISDIETSIESSLADPADATSDLIYDREWAVTLVNRVMEILASEQTREGRAEQFDLLKPWLLGDAAGRPQADTARALEWTENAMRVAVHRLRRRFRDLVKAEIAQTVEDPSRVQEELRYLIEVLSHFPPNSMPAAKGHPGIS